MQKRFPKKNRISACKIPPQSSTFSLSVNFNTLQKGKNTMAAHLENRDVQAGIEQAWHGLTKVVPVVQFEDCFPL